jgi:cell division transport system ATP-binding protein
LRQIDLVNFHHVTFRYPNGENILQNFSFVIRNNMFYFVTGNSGMGKTTFLRLMYGSIKPVEGCVSVFGTNTSMCNENDLMLIRQHMGLVFQDGRLFDHLTALDNVALTPYMTGQMSLERARELARELLDWVGLKQMYNQYPDQLSDGQKQRVGIARAVITKPVVILADEPTGHLDDYNSFKIMQLFIQLYEQGTSIVCVTHNQSLLNTFSFPRIHIRPGSVSLQQTSSQSRTA